MGLENDDEIWIPLVEFSVQKGISLSTLRRHIKSNKIPWKLIEGRYLIRDDGSFTNAAHEPTPLDEGLEFRIKNLEKSVLQAHEEIAELKTLIAFYEEKWLLNNRS